MQKVICKCCAILCKGLGYLSCWPLRESWDAALSQIAKDDCTVLLFLQGLGDSVIMVVFRTEEDLLIAV